MNKKTIAVIFGGRSVEHDVSILTGLQFIEALNPAKYDGIPIYVDNLGQWWTGPALLKRSAYPLNTTAKDLIQVHPDLCTAAKASRPRLTYDQKGLLGSKQAFIEFDLMVPAIHGSNGEDGSLQGLLEFAGIPYAGCRTLGSSATMNKPFAKQVARSLNIKVLDDLVLSRPKQGDFLNPDTVKAALDDAIANWSFPLIVKPCNLGSSIGVGKADDMDSLIAALMTAFRMDSTAIIEPFVDNLTEYNIAVMRGTDGTVRTSATEEPKRNATVLDFQNKYMAGGNAGGPKLDNAPSEGMASLNRTLNPDSLTPEQDAFIRDTSTRIFDAAALAGSVRIDFLCNSATGDIWLNEINTIPGSFAYFLWEAAEQPLSFLKLTDAIIEEGFRLSADRLGNTDAGAGGARIFS